MNVNPLPENGDHNDEQTTVEIPRSYRQDPTAAPIPPPESLPVMREHEKLSPIDTILQDWHTEQDTQKKNEKRGATLRRWLSPLKWAIPCLLLILLLTRAAQIIPAYERANVAAAVGDVSRYAPAAVGGATDTPIGAKPLSKGTTITSGDLPLRIATGENSNLMLTMAGGEALYVAANSLIEIRKLAYDGGAVREFILWRGQAGVRTQAGQSGKERFTFRTDAVKCDFSGNTRVSLTHVLQSNKALVRVAAPEGTAQVVYSGGEGSLYGGEQLSFAATAPPVKEAISLSDALIAEEERCLAAAPPPDATTRTLNTVDEAFLVPLSQPFRELLAIPERMNDVKRITVATAQMKSLCTLVGADNPDGAPAFLDLETLAPLSLPYKDREKLLDGFVNKRLYSYRVLPGGGYELLARAKDTKGTWIRGTNTGAGAAGTGDEPEQ